MMFRSFAGILLIFVVSGLFGQQADVQLNLTPLSQTESDWEFELSVDFNFTPVSGLAVVVPEDVMLVPVSLKINNKRMWLQNLQFAPEPDSVVAWQRIADGLMFIYKQGMIQARDRMELKCISSLLKMPLEDRKVQLKEVVSQTDGLKVSNQIIASGEIPAVSSR